MSESFDDMMRREFGANDGDEETPRMEDALTDVCRRYVLDATDSIAISELVIEAVMALARMRKLGDFMEAEGDAMPGFRRAFQAVLAHHLPLLILGNPPYEEGSTP